ncbi:methionine synthase reductase isoform X2 [Ischnura elegans]|uniref:methionine synthase reductase isoform X2 n=1 Tax=Ischnura elegans TaxID=197161 RepID=UPI001ED86885|nr:methionine synthase reductase isoform X2 [Ischnura elegans]
MPSNSYLNEDENFNFAPGDTVGIIPKNNSKEVEEILCHLGLRDKLDGKCVLSVVGSDESDSKKRKKIPPHLPRISTLRELFENCVEIRGPPKKVFLRALAEYASDPPEKGKLLKLCSREGSAEYAKVFNASSGDSPGFGLLQFFKSFPSCTPPVSVLLQHLPRLRPRPYSIASSPLEGNCLRIIFSVYKENSSKGVCTSWLESFLPPVDLDEQLSSLSLNPSQSEVPLFFRKSAGFCLPNDLSMPIILIGPGVGVAPYIGFLEHLSALRKVDKSGECGEVWLFYGCRHPDENGIYEKYLKNFSDKGVISRLFLSFSQYSGSFDNWNGSRYVQDSICSLGGTFVEQLVDKGATLYISGDGKNMFKDVRDKVAALIETHKGVTAEEASTIIKNLISKKMYLEDIWI